MQFLRKRRKDNRHILLCITKVLKIKPVYQQMISSPLRGNHPSMAFQICTADTDIFKSSLFPQTISLLGIGWLLVGNFVLFV